MYLLLRVCVCIVMWNKKGVSLCNLCIIVGSVDSIGNSKKSLPPATRESQPAAIILEILWIPIYVICIHTSYSKNITTPHHRQS